MFKVETLLVITVNTNATDFRRFVNRKNGIKHIVSTFNTICHVVYKTQMLDSYIHNNGL